MRLDEFDYELPRDRIAQSPAPERDGSRLLVMRRSGAPEIEHAIFRDLARFLRPEDLLVLNDTRVLPARLLGRKDSGGRVELILVERDADGCGEEAGSRRSPPRACRARRGARAEGPGGPETAASEGPEDLLLRASGAVASTTARAVGVAVGEADRPVAAAAAAPAGEVWLCLAGFSRAPAEGSPLDLGRGLRGIYLGPAGGDGLHRVRLIITSCESLPAAMKRLGRLPLPPYIARGDDPAERVADAERYQTVYARRSGAIAAPTAGLHFTEALLERLSAEGIAAARITLHVGPGTFLPVRSGEVEEHYMGAESYEVPRETAAAIREARSRGGRIVAVGTTAVRALESAADGTGGVLPARGRTDLYIFPGYRFRVVDALITNFHLPRSTLLVLVSAFAGRDRVLKAYREAIETGYRFYSYGDAMLIL